jgi:hypothetical protein
VRWLRHLLLSVVIMEVPCCGDLLRLAHDAVARAGRKVPVEAIVVGSTARFDARRSG